MISNSALLHDAVTKSKLPFSNGDFRNFCTDSSAAVFLFLFISSSLEKSIIAVRTRVLR